MKNLVISLFSILVILLSGCSAPAHSPTPKSYSLAPGEESILDVSLSDSISLVGKWRYRKVELFDPTLTAPEFDDNRWAEVDAPAPWSDQGLFDLVGTGALVVYRIKVEVPAEWQGQQIGISAWFNPYYGGVYLNGEAVEPLRKPFAPYTEVSGLLKFGKLNTIVVTTQYDGYLQFTDAGPVRLGPLVERPVVKVVHEDLKITSQGGEFEATLIRPEERTGLIGFVLDATGSHGMAEREPWFDLADDLARRGIASLVLVLPQQSPQGVLAGVEHLRSLGMVDPQKIVLFGVDQATQAVVAAAVADPGIAGVILLSPAPVQSAIELGGRPLLLLASQDDRRGMVLKQAQQIAERSSGSATVVSLPGDGHGTFVFTTVWNQIRAALFDWLKVSSLYHE